jgi:superfamily II DNA or RNA helicase
VDVTWRRYQQLALDAFERDLAAGRRNTHVVAPPGSGKTLLGIEFARRAGLPAVVLAPTSAIQAQWVAQAQRLGLAPGQIACLTYQAVARIEDPTDALALAAGRRWAQERAATTAQTVEEAERDAATWTGAAAERRTKELARITATLKREIARGEHDGLDLASLLAPGARERVDALRAAGTRTVVLDECHHLASLWGYVVAAILEELSDVHVVGLTATPPDELTESELGLYTTILGPVDFQVPTPAVVRDGFLAPYQELAWLTEPLDSELGWLAEHDTRFRELVTTLMDEDPELPTSLAAWVVTRARFRDRGGPDEGEVSWADFQRRRPALARASVRFLASAGLSLPPGAPRGEGYREQPDLDDWLVLLEDWALRSLGADPSPAAAARYEAVAAALRDLGFTLTRRGIRRGASDADRLLTTSAAKPIALAEILAAEMEARGDALRAVVLVDAELASAKGGPALAGVLDREAGTGIAALRALAADLRTAPLRPLLVSGRGLRCMPSDAEQLAAGLGEGVRAEPDGDLARLAAPGWEPRVFVALATALLAGGGTGAIVGTRGLLGEGWDAPAVNCLVDLTSVAAGVSVRQMRGRTLRLDPGDPEKIASNWDVVCVAPELARGAGDYRRFVRRHLHLHAPCEDGTIEAGPSHVHPALGPFAPPPAGDFVEINRAMRARAAAHGQARERWRIGTPYVGEDHTTVVVRQRRGGPAPPAGGAADGPPRFPARGPAVALRLVSRREYLTPSLPLDRVAHAVAEAGAEAGLWRAQAAASLAIEPRAAGYLRCLLRAADARESTRFAAALDEALRAPEAPRYLVSRLVAPPGRGGFALFIRAVTFRRPFDERWSAVPAELGRRKEGAEAYHRAWRRWIGPSRLLFTQRSDEGREARAQAASQASDYDTQLRDVWV